MWEYFDIYTSTLSLQDEAGYSPSEDLPSDNKASGCNSPDHRASDVMVNFDTEISE